MNLTYLLLTIDILCIVYLVLIGIHWAKTKKRLKNI